MVLLMTPRTLRYTIRIIQLGSRLGCHPYRLNAVENRVEVTKSRIQYLAWMITALGSVLYYAFLVGQWFRLQSSEPGKFNAFLSFALVFFAFPVFFHLNMIVSMVELPEFVNTYLKYNDRFQERYVLKQAQIKPLARFCEFTVVYVYSAFWLDYAAYVVVAFIRTDGPEQVSSLVATDMWDPRRLALTALYYYYGAGYVINACLMIFTAFGFFFSAFQILQEFGKWSSRFTSREFHRGENLVQVYHELSLLVDGVDRTYHVIIAAAKTILILLSILCMYAGIRLHGLIAATLGIIGGSTTIFLAVILTAWSEFESVSKKALRVLVRLCGDTGHRSYGVVKVQPVLLPHNVQLLRRQVGTLKPLTISVLNMYVIDKLLVLTVIKIISEQIIFLLVKF